ncbi:MAG: type II CRISPR RNA-guided endonuclease Cas9 [Deltaproteobacteria bacterium]|nr:type II CRISPR RNA-guided endonuclease Cas9 [Deltaproteobacteria bacterium]
MSNFTLGLDLGTNSIGWAMIGHNNEEQPSGLIACGTRIFQEAVDAKTKTPKNKARRDARSARKLVSRRKMRRDNLLNLLLQNNLLPKDASDREKLLTDNKLFDPYQLRKKALDEKLTPYELGRVLYHLCQRRGFLSNRKAKSKEDGDVITAITSLQKEIVVSKSRTLGEYLANQPVKRNRYTDRAMYQEEFERIWQSQQKHYPDLLNQVFKVTVHNTIFFQRPLNLQKNLVGKCTFEPSRKRATRALLETQRFRILQDINNLTVKNPITRAYRSLAIDEREKLLNLLEKQKTLGWSAARKKLKLHEGETFNLEEGKKKELMGNRTDYALRSILKEQWNSMTQEKQNAFITDMLTINSEQGFLNRMTSHWDFDAETAEGLAKTELEPGYARLSRKAICNILPYLEQGMTYDKACLEAGYDHSNPNSSTTTDKLGEPPYLRNPVVQKALYETRKVINAIIREYGKPQTIRIEMARDMKLTKKQKEALQKKQNENKKANEKAKKILQDEFMIQNPTRDDIQKYNMWLECKGICPYTGTTISREMLFSPEVDVEHILPYSRTLDDSYMNKTLCMAAENRTVKQNKTPFDAYHANTEKYEGILQRVKILPWPKRKKFEQKEIDTDKFVERQLNDTRYICTEVKKYLQSLGVSVEVSKGEATATLRHRWNLNRILARDGIIEKNREDHRHHTVDAVVIALTSRALFQKLSRLSAQSNVSLSERGFYLDKPWQSFYEDVDEKVKNIIVSHAPSRKISGALHEETAYGYSENEECFVYRKPLSSLTENEIEKIRDAKIKQIVQERLARFDSNLKKAFGDENNPLFHVDGKTPIKSVRLKVNLNKDTTYAIADPKGSAYKYFKYGNNHHVEIIENITTGQRKGIFIAALEAAKRARKDKTAIVQRDHGAEWRFVMSLAINDLVETKDGGIIKLYRIQKLSSGKQMEITLKHLNDSVPDYNDNTWAIKSAIATKKAIVRKVAVDALGNIRTCND